MATHDLPSHTSLGQGGTARGERRSGRTVGRDKARGSRGSRDATGINAEKRAPIDPSMPKLPPA